MFSFPELTVKESSDFISAAPLPFSSKPREITSLLGHEVGDESNIVNFKCFPVASVGVQNNKARLHVCKSLHCKDETTTNRQLHYRVMQQAL